MVWSGETKEKLRELLADTPPAYRKYLDGVVEAAAEFHAKRLGKSEIDEESIVRGYITTVPRHLRDGLTEVLSQHNYDMMYFRPIFDEPQFILHPKNHAAPPIAH